MTWMDTPPYNQNNTTQSHGYAIHGLLVVLSNIGNRTIKVYSGGKKALNISDKQRWIIKWYHLIAFTAFL